MALSRFWPSIVFHQYFLISCSHAGCKPNTLEQVARWSRVLSDETRLRIIECFEDGEQCMYDLMTTLDMRSLASSFEDTQGCRPTE